MKKVSESLTTEEFFTKLQQDKLSEPITLIGMVKMAERKEKSIQFAFGTNCSNWIIIQLETIEKVDMLKIVRCKDHSHALVKLYLKEPKNPEAISYAAILKAFYSNQNLSSENLSWHSCNLPGCRKRRYCDLDDQDRIIWSSCRTICECDEDSPFASFPM